MQDYISLRITPNPCSEDITDLLADYLGEIGFESFTPDSSGLTAFIKDNLYDEALVASALEDFPIQSEFSITAEFVKGENWNEEWEKHYFQPIIIADRCVVHSSFHHDVPTSEFEIIVDPKMAFGTGHHSTTSNMITHILNLDLQDKSVIDMGTGTGILAILCCMKGAKDVTGIEIDPFAYENAVENVRLNGCTATMICGDANVLSNLKPVDIFMANINRNVILEDLEKYASVLKKNGIMLLSGFYKSDIPMIENAASGYGLRLEEVKENEEWVALRLVKSN